VNRLEGALGSPSRLEGGTSGLALLRKSSGETSFRSLGSLKRALGTGKVGHAGTLDKFASGLLVALVGRYTRMNEFVSAGEKTYRGLVRFGEETDTLDPEGRVVASAPSPSREAIDLALPAFRGEIEQRPPTYSALHIDGKRAYERALAGEAVEMRARKIRISELRLESYDGRDGVLFVRCGPGTYIRSLARDIALACGSRASLVGLERLAVGPFRLEEAVSPESFDPGRDLRALGMGEARALGLGILSLGERDSARFLLGAPIGSLDFAASPGCAASEGGCSAVFDQAGAFLGIVEGRDGRYSYKAVVGA